MDHDTRSELLGRLAEVVGSVSTPHPARVAVDGPPAAGKTTLAIRVGTALGLLVSAFATTEFQAVQFMPAFVLPQILLCGLFVPREAMPGVLEAISNVLPLSYAVDAMQELVGRADQGEVWRSVAVVAVFALAALALGAATLKRRTP